MVKFGKNKFRALNKIARNQKITTGTGVTNKILKKKINAEKKVTFQKEVLLKEAVVSGGNALVKNVTANEIIRNDSKKREKKLKEQEKLPKPKKPVEKRRKRQKTQIDDTKLMLRLMKKSR